MNKSMKESKVLQDMVLVLLYSYSWKEKVTENLSIQRSWKGYDFGLLDALKEQGFISSSYRAKSVVFTEEGLEQAKKLKERMLSTLENFYIS